MSWPSFWQMGEALVESTILGRVIAALAATMSVRASQAAGCSAGGRAVKEAVLFDRLSEVALFLPAT